MENQFMIVNISWNKDGWRYPYPNPKSGHKYAREFPGHESLNFFFDKKGVDTDEHVFGFFQWQARPVRFSTGGTIVFYSHNTKENKGQIVGIYSNVEILENPKVVTYKGFENDILVLNLKAEKELSMLFPIPLDANLYKQESGKRLVGQVGYSYYDIPVAEKIILDEITELSKSGIRRDEFSKLRKIYYAVTGKVFQPDFIDSDEVEQQELVDILAKESKKKIIDNLLSLKETEPETVTVNNKVYKRDNQTIANLKIYRDHKCQICGTKIRKSGGGFYIEAAHITPKHKKGRETPDNLLILCPNHHKEFDYGDMVIKHHSKEKINFLLNGINYEIDLSIQQVK